MLHSIMNVGMLDCIENLTTLLLKDFVTSNNARFYMINCYESKNFTLNRDKILRLRNDIENLMFRCVAYRQKRSRYRFAMIVYVIAQVHRALLLDGLCMTRELFYKNTFLTRSQTIINSAIRDVCSVLQCTPWKLGIHSSGKGLVSGALRMHMCNGDVIDCRSHERPTLLPQICTEIDHLETNASFVLLVEKDTIFQKLLSNNIFCMFDTEIILITGKGFPDFSTRLVVQLLSDKYGLPIFALVDADPFGLEILFVYQHGSQAISHITDKTASPQVRWLGIHPSEVAMMAIPTTPFTQQDEKKMATQLKRNYLDEGILHELDVLNNMKQKAELENLSNFSLNFLITDYIPNKIKRNLLI